MKRRNFLGTASVGAAALAFPAPAIAQSQPEVRWRLQSAFPHGLDLPFGISDVFAKYVSEATDGKFQVQTFAAGEIVGPVQLVDAVSNGTVEAAHTNGVYYLGIDPTFALSASIPFGMNARQMMAWQYHGGGLELFNEFLADKNIHGLPGGNTGTQMGGFFRKEINALGDLQGLKFRVSGLAGEVLSRLGVVPQSIPAADVYPSLERGTIDAAEWVGPYDDYKLGLHKIAPNYYYPGWWEGGPSMYFYFNKEKWESLPKSYQSIAHAATVAAGIDVLNSYDAKNIQGLKSLLGEGAKLKAFPADVLEASQKMSVEVLGEIADKNPAFKKIHDSYTSFRDDAYLWYQVADNTFDNVMIRARRRG